MLFLLAVVPALPAWGLQLEPRPYSPAPVGATTINGVTDADRQENSRVGLTLAVPVSKAHSLKFGYARGTTTRVGAKLDTISVGWQFLWFDRP